VEVERVRSDMMVARPENEISPVSLQASPSNDLAQSDAFWTFALNLYSDQRLSEVFLRLQDFHSADVTIVLLLLWLAAWGRALDVAELSLLNAELDSWRQDVVKPLRQVRRFLKNASVKFDGAAVQELRLGIKHSELEAERIQMQLLSKLCPVDVSEEVDRRNIVQTARGNLTNYQALLSTEFASADVDVLISAL
jgi:uncharacterized protein (TIGR02444 family)